LRIRPRQRIPEALRGPFPCLAEAKRFLVQQLATPHNSEMFRPTHGKLNVTKAGRLEFVVCVLYLLRTHRFRQTIETLDREFGQQPGNISEVVSRRTVGNACSPRAGTERQSFDTGLADDLLRRLQQRGAEIPMVIAISLACHRRISSNNPFHCSQLKNL